MRHGVDVDPELGAMTILCVRGVKPKPCVVCGKGGRRLCDGLKAPLAFGSPAITCDASLCDRCTTSGAGGAAGAGDGRTDR